MAYTSFQQAQEVFGNVVNGGICISDIDGTAAVGFVVCHHDDLDTPLSFRINDLGIMAHQLFNESIRREDGWLDVASVSNNPLHQHLVISPQGYFASDVESLNAYIRPELIRAIQHVVANHLAHVFIPNTGRGYDELEQILLQSGLEQDSVNQMYSVTSHGTQMRTPNGEMIQLVPELTESDNRFLDKMFRETSGGVLRIFLMRAITQTLEELGYEKSVAYAATDKLNCKRKEKSLEVGIRALLESLSSNLAKTTGESISTTIAAMLQKYIDTHNKAQLEKEHRLNLGIVEENLALEIRQLGVCKALGMEELVKYLLNHGVIPTGTDILFGADSLLKTANGIVSERTDYSAACFCKMQQYEDLGDYLIGALSEIDELQTAYQLGVMGSVVYVHYPIDAKFIALDARPSAGDPSLDMPANHPMVIDATLASPVEYSTLLAQALLQRATG